MRLSEQMRREGEVLFRLRSYLPLLLLLPFALALRESQWIEDRFGDRVDDVYDWFCVGISLLGLGLRFAIAGTVPRRTSGRNTTKGQVADSLNTTGAYSIVRHPLYVANFFVFLGVCLTPGVWWMAGLGIAAFWLFYERIMLAEEAFLHERFRRPFEAWAERTPAFLPDLQLWRAPALPFCVRTAIKREYLTVLGCTVVFAALDYTEDALASGLGGVEWEAESTLACAIVVVVCLAIRFLRKRTQVLHVAGR